MRIGDSILSLPALFCLEQLNKKYNSGYSFKVLTRPLIHPVLKSILAQLNSFECVPMSTAEKIKSFLNTPEQVFFLETTNENLGYFSKKSYGRTNRNKKFIKFTNEFIYIVQERIRENFPQNLSAFLIDEKKLSMYSAAVFGICLEAGYSPEQIIEIFEFSPDSVCTNVFASQKFYNPYEKYIVFCMEAGYGRKEQKNRYWNEENYFRISRDIFAQFAVKSAFIGVNKGIPLPCEEFIRDFRGELSLFESACMLKNSIGYVGNDTGPLHLANIMNKPSVSVYFAQHLMYESSPIFYELNTQFYNPESPEEVYGKIIQQILKA